MKKRGGRWLLIGGLLLALGYGVAGLYHLRVARGDLFPEYSSLRADALGVRAMHDAAGLLPGRAVVRWLRPLDRLQAGAGDVVFVTGVDGLPEDDWLALDRLAVSGARVVVAWRAEKAQDGDRESARGLKDDPWAKKEKPEKLEKADKTAKVGKKSDEKKKTDDAATRDKRKPSRDWAFIEPTDGELRWGYRIGRRDLLMVRMGEDAVRSEDAASNWPLMLARWRSDLYFLTKPAEGWKVWYRRGTEPVMISRTRGAGSIVLLADSYLLSNEAVQRDRATPVLAALLGESRRVVFVESHLGVEADSGIAVLARRYGLGGAALTALLLAGLWMWRRGSPLAPIIPEDEEVRLTLAPTAGLEALLRRAITPAKLFSACLDAWRAQATAGDRRRLDAATPPAAGTDPVAAYNATTRTLSHKRIP